MVPTQADDFFQFQSAYEVMDGNGAGGGGWCVSSTRKRVARLRYKLDSFFLLSPHVACRILVTQPGLEPSSPYSGSVAPQPQNHQGSS